MEEKRRTFLGFPHGGGMVHYARVYPSWYIALGLGMAWIKEGTLIRISTWKKKSASIWFSYNS
jgi:hypothetical protein